MYAVWVQRAGCWSFLPIGREGEKVRELMDAVPAGAGGIEVEQQGLHDVIEPRERGGGGRRGEAVPYGLRSILIQPSGVSAQ